MKMPSRNARTNATCKQCGEHKKPVIRIMKADGMTPDNYVCSSCRAENGRAELRKRVEANQ